MNLTSKCKLEVFCSDGYLDDCTNVEQEHQFINELLSVGEFSFYLIAKVEQSSINCPGFTIKW